ncbi:MAG: hypothetical protein PHE25_01070 [Candidatus Gracilibacteria bacterium]|nr:hypothetical protein [Candidatus Gracilibacteria bacterium]
MNNLVKKSVYSTVGMLSLVQVGVSQVFATSTTTSAPDATFGVDNAATVTGGLEDQPLSEALQTYVNYVMTFLYLIAVGYALWGGFQILTAGGEEDKVKKGKTILIQGGIGLLVIFLAGSIVKWVLSLLAA